MNETSTLGGRIQEGRKAAGLSQEALGERLGVSRQAVSKWESDAAIPELENLIAMSRSFGVSIGALLGVEPAEEKQPKAERAADAPSGELTDRELAALEAIAAQYTAAAQPARPRWSVRRRVLVGLCCAAAVFGAAFAAVRLSSLDRQMQTLQNQLNNVQYKMDDQIGVISSQISNILDEKNNIFTNSTVEITGFSWKDQTVTLSVSSVPREWTAETSAQFAAALSDGRTFSAEGTLSDGCFKAEGWVVPMDDQIDLSATLTDGGANRTGLLDTLYGCSPGSFLPEMYGSFGSMWTSNTNTIQLYGLSVYIAPGFYQYRFFDLAAAEVRIYRNGAAEPEQVLPVSDAPELWQTAGQVDMSDMAGYETEVALAPNDRIAVQLWAADDRENWYSCDMDGFFADENGAIDTDDSGMSGQVTVH